MIRIRLRRGGVKGAPFYHIVVANSKSSRDGRFIERVGFFNPIISSKNKRSIHIDLDRIKYWKNQGAQLSKRVFFLIKKQILLKSITKI